MHNRLDLKIKLLKQQLDDTNEILEELSRGVLFQEKEIKRLQNQRVSQVYRQKREITKPSKLTAYHIQQKIMKRMVYLNQTSSDENEIRLDELAKFLDWIEGYEE